MTHAHAFVALCIVWAVSQSLDRPASLRRRRKARDRGTLDLLIVVIAREHGARACWLAMRDDGQLAARDCALRAGRAWP